MNSVLVGQELVPQYQWLGVVISYVVAVLGSFAALQCARQMFNKDGSLDWGMATCAAVALGGIGIWSMHFIGMLAYRPGVVVSYEVFPTALSLVAAVLISGLALYLAGRGGRFTTSGWVAGSVVAGLGVCVMHYMGMYAMNMRATMTWSVDVIGVSVAIAIAAATAALWLAFNLQRTTHQLGAAFVMGIAVCAMHYTGMSAVTLICTSAAPSGTWLLGTRHLDVVVFATAALVLVYLYWVLSARAVRRAMARPAAARVVQR